MTIGPSDTLGLLAALNGASGPTVGGFPISSGAADSTSLSFGPDALPDLTDSGNAVLGPLQAAYSGSLNPSAPAQSPRAQKAELREIGAALDAADENRLDDARSILDGVLKRNRQSSAAFGAFGEVELRAGNYARAEQYFQRAAGLDPETGYERRAQDAVILQQDDDTVFARAQQKLAAPDTRADGIRLLAALTSRAPDHVDARVALAEGLLKDGNAAGSLLQYQLAITGADQNQLAKIESRLTELAEEAPKAVFLRKLLAEAQLGQGKNSAARQTLEVAARFAEDPATLKVDQARAAVGLGRESLAAGDVTSALDKFQQAAGLDGKAEYVHTALAEAYVARGESRARLGQRTAAVEDFRLAARQVPAGETELRKRAAHGAYAVGASLKRRREQDDGSASKEVVALQAAYDIDPTNLTYRRQLADSRHTLGDEFAADGKLKDAAFAYRRAYDLQRSNASYKSDTITAFHAYGDERRNHSDFTAAIDAYRTAYSIDQHGTATRQKLASGFNARGENYVAQGRFDLALKDFKEAVKFDPDNSTYHSNLNSVGG